MVTFSERKLQMRFMADNIGKVYKQAKYLCDNYNKSLSKSDRDKGFFREMLGIEVEK